MRPSGTNIFQHFHASFFFLSVRSHATVSNMQMSEWMSVRMSIWMSVWMYEWQISKFTQQFQSQTLYLSSCERIWSHPSCSRCRQRRWERDGQKRKREREEEIHSSAALHPQFSFNWLSPEENGKLDLACKLAIFHCQKRKQVKIVRQKCSRYSIDTRSILE